MATAAQSQQPVETTRWSWNAWPISGVEAKKHLVIPIGCVHTPLAPGVTRLPYEPLMCRGPCRTVLNPHAAVDVRGKLWSCPFCYQRNPFPPQYSEISETNLPAELFPQYSAIEYTLPTAAPTPTSPPVFLFALDVCLPPEELKSLKDTVIQGLGLLPQNCLVGFMTFGTTVQVYELSFTACPKAYVFTGTREYTAQKIQELLGLPARSGGAAGSAPNAPGLPNSFFVPLSECEFNLTSILEDLQRDPWPMRSEHRALVSTGTAIGVGVGLLEGSCRGVGAKMVVFAGGPCTQGPGMVVSDDLKDNMRSHNDIVKDKAKYTRKASKVYEGLAQRAAANGHSVDLYCCNIDQVGLHEMQDLCRRTGGIAVVSEGFSKDTFSKTFLQSLDKDAHGDLVGAFSGYIEVQATRELKISGAVGPLSSLERRTPAVSDSEVGIGGTSAWRVCSLDHRTSYAFFFEIAGAPAPQQGGAMQPQQQQGLVQFLTRYQTSSGQNVLRVTTVGRPWTDTSVSLQPLAESFDQETATVLVARQAAYKLDNEEPYDVLRWIDRLLIRLVSKFGQYQKDEWSSLRLSPRFSLFPQFMFHLRRSHFVQVFNSSPDESAFYRLWLLRENVPNSLVMIQPLLDAYELNKEPTTVLLSTGSLQENRVLLLDTFFTVVVFLSHDVFMASKQGLADRPEGAAFKEMLSQPIRDAQEIIKDRFPSPKYIECAQFSGDARHLLTFLDPANTYNTQQGAQKSNVSEAVLTDDVSFLVFFEHLKRAAVTQQS